MEDFQSFVPGVENVLDIKNVLGTVLSNPEKIVKKTTPVESEYWSADEIEHFTLNLEDVNRLYYLNSYTNSRYIYNSCHRIRMVGRMNYKNKTIYFEFFYISDSDNYMFVISHQYTYIYFSEDPFLFMNVICFNRNDEAHDNMVNSFRLDGIVPNLSYMCQQKLYNIDLEIPLHVKRRLNIDRNVTQEAINDYSDFCILVNLV